MQTKSLAAVMEVLGVGKTLLQTQLKGCELLGWVLAGPGGALRMTGLTPQCPAAGVGGLRASSLSLPLSLSAEEATQGGGFPHSRRHTVWVRRALE